MSDATNHGAPLDEVRRRRAELRQSMGLVEFTIAQPVRHDPLRWLDAVEAALVELDEDWSDHIDVTEGGKGLYADVKATAPRLSRKINRLLAEHEVLAEMLTDLRQAVASARTKPAEVATVRAVATRMLTQLSKHRQRGSDLVWEAYAFDVGGEN